MRSSASSDAEAEAEAVVPLAENDEMVAVKGATSGVPVLILLLAQANPARRKQKPKLSPSLTPPLRQLLKRPLRMHRLRERPPTQLLK